MYAKILHVYLLQKIDIKCRIARGRAQSYQNAEPLDTQGVAASSKFCTNDSNVVKLVVVGLAANRDDGVTNKTVTIGWGLVELTSPLGIDLAASSRTVEHVDHELAVVHVIRRHWLQRGVQRHPDLRVRVVERLHSVGFRFQQRTT